MALVAPPFLPVPPPGYGGIERIVAAVAEGLVRHGHDVTVYAAPGSSTTARLVTPLRAPAVLGDPSSAGDELYHAMAAYLDASSFDVIHDHTGLGPALGAVLSGSPAVVHTLHGPWTEPARRFFEALQRRVHLVAISHAQRAANGGLHYAGVVHNGVDLARYRFNPAKEDFLLFLGRVSPEKRPEVAIDVARRAGRPLVMVVKRTEPAERDYWEAVVAPRLGDDVEVLDQPSHEVKVDVLGRARAMLFPIDWPEPFGLVMVEAMACGTPVVARRLGAAPEVVDDGTTGYLCWTDEEMVKAVDAVGDLDPADCRHHVDRHFSADAMVAGYERIYHRALVECTTGPGRRTRRPGGEGRLVSPL
ncbi:MAG TPA: glycosyltransferase family 4 protein [Acidimicrobiales bacterium]|nr:glycosyltransferase family 4 protein [Acidimicrobiales bacterium]